MIEVLNQLEALRLAMGQTLTKEQQLFVSAHWQELRTFLATDEGRIALQTFVDDWQTQTKKAPSKGP